MLISEQIVDLSQRRPHFNLRVDQTGRPYHLLDHAPGMFGFVVTRCRRNENGLRADPFPLVETHWPVVQRRGQTEAVFDQRLFTRTVAFIHRADLRHADVGFVDHQQGIGRQVIVKGGRRRTGRAPGQVARVVFDAVAVAQFENHLQVETGALLQTLGFHQFVVAAQVFEAFLQLDFDVFDGVEQGFPGRHIVALRVEGETRHLADDFAGQRVKRGNALDFVIEQFDADRFQIGFRRVDIDHIATYAERCAGKIHVVAGVLQVGQTPQQRTLIEFVPAIDVQHHLQIGFRAAQTVDARHRGDDDRVLALKQRFGRRQPHLLDVVIDRRVLLDEGVGRRHISFGLVVVVVGNEVFDGVVREERLELAIQLRGQGLVRCQYQCRALYLRDDIGDAEGLARTGHTEQRLVRQPGFDAFHQLANGFRLIAGGFEAGDELEFGHIHLWIAGLRAERSTTGTTANDRCRARKNLDCAQCGGDCLSFQGKRPASGKDSDTAKRLTVEK